MTEAELKAISEVCKFLMAHITEMRNDIAELRKHHTKVGLLYARISRQQKEIKQLHELLGKEVGGDIIRANRGGRKKAK